MSSPTEIPTYMKKSTFDKNHEYRTYRLVLHCYKNSILTEFTLQNRPPFKKLALPLHLRNRIV